MRVNWGSLVLGVLAGCSAATARPPATTVAPAAGPLLDAWAAAVGGRERLRGVAAIHLAGRLEQGGMRGKIDVWETARGERRDEQDLAGVDRGTVVFDGARGWTVDRNGWVRELDGPEVRDEVALAYWGAWAALLPERRAGRVARDGDNLLLEPSEGRSLTVRFDPATHLPATVTRTTAEKTRVLSFSDWREVKGLRVPFTIREDDGNPANLQTIQVETVELAAPPARAFARPPDAAPDLRFDAGGEAVIPVEIVAQLIFARARVNGSEPLDFIVDTGAEVTVLNRSRLARLGLTAVGLFGESAGGGDVETSFVKGVSFALPGVTLEKQTVTAMPLDGLEGMLGHSIDGVLGYDFLSRFVVELDYAHARMTVRARASAPAPKGVAVPITLQGGVPNVRAGIEQAGRGPLAGTFILDTGCTCEVEFNAPFTRAERLVEALPRVFNPPRGSSFGAGGETFTVLGRLAAVNLGSLRVVGPIASFAHDEKGGMADRDSAGLIGGRILQHFVVTLDYQRKTMWLDQVEPLDRPTPFAGSGVFWAKADAGIAVRALVDGSPGAEAGLAVGDRLVSFDGRPAAKVTLDELAAVFRKVGQPHALVVERDGRKVEVKLAGRDLL